MNEVEIDTKFLLKDIENDEKISKKDLKRKVNYYLKVEKREYFSDKDKMKKNKQ